MKEKEYFASSKASKSQRRARTLDWKDKRDGKKQRHKMQKAKEQQETGGGGNREEGWEQ